MYKTIMIVGVIAVALGWLGYGIYRSIIYYQEKNQPRKRSEHLEKVRKSFDEFEERMATYKKKRYERES